MRKVFGIAIIAVLVAAVAAPALASTAGATHPVKKARVDVNNYQFDPTHMTIKKGTKVVWTWFDGRATRHDIAVKKGPVKFHSRKQKSGTFSHLFNTKGTYHLICTLHPQFMTITVVVK